MSKLRINRLLNRVNAQLNKKLFLILFFALTGIGFCFSQDSEKLSSSALITKKDGGIIELGKTRLEIPFGAVKKDLIISIERLDYVNETGELLKNSTEQSGGYRFLPAGTKFKKPVKVIIPYDKNLSQEKIEELKTYFYDKKKMKWIELNRLYVDTENCVVISETTHFTDMINAFITLPETSKNSDININSIKNLEAARPDTHLLKFNSPKANNSGDANLSFNLDVLHGRRGLEPSLDVIYSSGFSNGTMGRGFELVYGSSVTTDTRKGLPEYNFYDQYLLDGIKLELESEDETWQKYSPLKINSFQIIRRNKKENYWEKILSDGTVFRYGAYKIYSGDAESCVVGSGQKIFTWNLTEVIDVNGNTIVYLYKKDSGYVYIEKILYTGFYDGNRADYGKYYVNFEYIKDTDNKARRDVRVEARSHSPVECRYLLRSIESGYDGRAFRTYEFNYKTRLADESYVNELIVNNLDLKDSYSYKFEYNELENYGTKEKPKYKLFSEPVEWNESFPVSVSSTISSSQTVNAAAGAGLGTEIADVRASFGYQGSQSISETRGEDMLIDVNGDGHLDLVFTEDGWIKAVLSGQVGTVYTICKGELDKEISVSMSNGFTAYGGGGLNIPFVPGLGITVSNVCQRGSSKVEMTLMDIDGDSLVDVVKSGSSSYLKNIGNMKFVEMPFYCSDDVKICDVTENLSDEKKREYENLYRIQKPFRAWKALYDGTVLIQERSSPAENFSDNNSIQIETYFDDEENPDKDLSGVVKKDNVIELNSARKIKKDEYLFFCEDVKNDPRNKDINWNIKIKYQNIKPFKNYLTSVAFIPEKSFSVSGGFSSGEMSVKEKLMTRLKEQYGISSDYLLLYDSSVQTEYFESGSNSVLTLALKSDWKNVADKNSCVTSELMTRNRYIPGCFTHEQLLKIVQLLALEEIEDYKGFTDCFIYDANDDFYKLNVFSEEKLDELYQNYFCKIDYSVCSEVLENYKTLDMMPVFYIDRYEYKGNFKEKILESERGQKFEGSVFDFGKKIFLGKVCDDNLCVDLSKEKVLVNGNESDEWTVDYETENDGDLILLNIKNEKRSINILYKFCDKTICAKNISNEEYEKIFEDFKIEKCELNNSYWSIKNADYSQVKEKIDFLNLSLAEESEFIENAFEKKIVALQGNLSDSLSGSLSDESSEIVLYSIKQDEKSQKYIQKKLEDYRKSYFENKYFYFYKKNQDGYYLLPEWEKIIYKYSEKEQQDYLEEVLRLKDICKEYGLYKYCYFERCINYDSDAVYSVQPDSTYKVVVFDKNDNLVERSCKLEKFFWDSYEDFSNENLCEPKVFEIADDCTVQILSCDVLYGGKNSWYYGIFTGNEKFSKRKLFGSVESYKEKYSCMDQQQLEKEKEQMKNSTADCENINENNFEYKTEQNWYQVKKNEKIIADGIELDNFPIVKEAETSLETELLADCLIGNVNTVSKIDGQTIKSEFYMPFVYRDFIHCNRNGGNAYYEIEGLSNSGVVPASDGGNFILPAIRKSYSNGMDINAGFSATCSNSFDVIQKIMQIDGSVSAGYTSGANNTQSCMKQLLMDVNGDGVSDILQVTDEGIKVTVGKKDKDGKIIFEEGFVIKEITELSNYSSNTSIKGGSFSASGSVAVQTKSSGKISLSLPVPASGSPSFTTTNGNSVQKSGFIDLNGDGLCDFVSENNFYLNTGNSFEKFTIKNLPSQMSKSKSQSVSANLNVGFSASDKCESSSCGVSAGAGFNYSVGFNKTIGMFVDVNGDGLCDYICKEGGECVVFYNNGSGFSGAVKIEIPEWNILEDEKNLLFSKSDAEFCAGALEQVPYIGSAVKSFLTDIGYWNFYRKEILQYADALDFSSNVGLGLSCNVGANINIGIRLMYVVLNITSNIGGGFSASTSLNDVSVKMLDIDGDGLVDQVLRIPGKKIYYKKNLSGKSGLLKRVILPQGGMCELDYDERYGDVNDSHFKYVMKSVTFDDGRGKILSDVCVRDEDGLEYEGLCKSEEIKFKYENSYYDRNEKESFGFSSVITQLPDGTCSIDKFNSDLEKYYLKGAVIKTESYGALYSDVSSDCYPDVECELLKETTVEYDDAPFVRAVCETTEEYEVNSPGKKITVVREYEYDDYSNLTKQCELYNDGHELNCEIEYEYNREKNLFCLPVSVNVFERNNLEIIPLRHREACYNDLGQMKKFIQFYGKGESDYLQTTLDYDKYGNVTKVTGPGGAYTRYEYDKALNMFPEKIAVGSERSVDAGGEYVSTFEYDDVTQTKKSETDCNLNTMEYEYDNWQRIKAIVSPYDKSSNPCVRYSYFTPSCEDKNEGVDSGTDSSTQNDDSLSAETSFARAGNVRRPMWYALTENKCSFDPDDKTAVKTFMQVDGLGRVLCTAKSAEVYDIDRGIKSLGWVLSGAKVTDKKGRTVKEGMSYFIEDESDRAFFTEEVREILLKNPVKYFYDSKDRVIKTILPDGAVQTTEYKIVDGAMCVETTDPLKNKTVQLLDSRGKISEILKYNSDDKLLTKSSYFYDLAGQLIEARDAKENSIKSEFNLLGQRTKLESNDSGTLWFEYDKYGNLIRKTDSRLLAKGQNINYEYDDLNRLVKVDYPESEDTFIEYGESDSADGSAGRIKIVRDSSGSLCYEYGRLGEVVKESRTLNRHQYSLNEQMSAVTCFESDYFGQLKSITYPDGEKVSYEYDAGGQVCKVKGRDKYGTDFNYVNEIGYDQNGKRVIIEYGNGVVTKYSYDPKRLWLKHIETKSQRGRALQNVDYSFDKVGNVLSYENDCLTGGNYKTVQSYDYDSLYQLTGVNGTTEYNRDGTILSDHKATYKQSFTFDKAGLGNMTSKISSEEVLNNRKIGDDLNYSFDYEYDSDYAHRLIRAGNRYFKYDEAGNVIAEKEGSFDDDGERIYKVEELSENVYGVDSAWGYFVDEDKALENAGDSTQKNKYRCDYFWNEENLLVRSNDGTNDVHYVYGHDGMRTNKFTAKGETLYFNDYWVWHTDSGVASGGGKISKNVYLGKERIVTKISDRDSMSSAQELENMYYYHTDHLGSAQLVTNARGEEYQRLEYTPYGETWVDLKSTNTLLTKLPYKFTAKELDEETGLYYYGARYLDPKISRWMSADPALSEYMGKSKSGMGGIYNGVNMNLYHYAGNNPVKYTDPDGRDHGMPSAIEQQMKQRNVCVNGNTTARSGLPPNIEREMKSLSSYTHGIPAAEREQITLKENRRIRIRQQDIKFPNPQGPCFYLALLAAAQEKAKKNLDFNQVEDSTKYLISIGAMDSNYYVKDPTAVVKDALNRLGCSYVNVIVTDYKDCVDDVFPDYTIRNVLDKSHFQLGDCFGLFLWEPYRYNDENNADKGVPDKIREVYIK